MIIWEKVRKINPARGKEPKAPADVSTHQTSSGVNRVRKKRGTVARNVVTDQASNTASLDHKKWWERGLLPISILLIACLSFGLGKLSEIKKERIPIKIEDASGRIFDNTPSMRQSTTTISGKVIPTEEKAFVASKNGGRYYLPNCSGVSRIKDENKIWFSSKEEAAFNGYTPAINCF